MIDVEFIRILVFSREGGVDIESRVGFHVTPEMDYLSVVIVKMWSCKASLCHAHCHLVAALSRWSLTRGN